MMLEIVSKLEEANVGASLKRFKQRMKALDEMPRLLSFRFQIWTCSLFEVNLSRSSVLIITTDDVPCCQWNI